MYVCLCKQITTDHIRKAIDEGRVENMKSLAREMGVATQCGKCAHCARKLVDTCGCMVDPAPATLPA